MNHASISGRNLDKAITSDDILGKNVIDIEGKILGVAEKVLIDSKSLDFIGIEVDKGFLKKGITIGKSYIEKITHHAVFLNIKVVYEIKGLKVYDKTGANLGTVSNLELYGIKNKIGYLIETAMMINHLSNLKDLLDYLQKNKDNEVSLLVDGDYDFLARTSPSRVKKWNLLGRFFDEDFINNSRHYL